MYKHQDFSGKYCPHRTLDRSWQRYLDMVSAALKAGNATPDPSAPSADGYKVGDTVIVSGYPCQTAYGDKPGKYLDGYCAAVTRVCSVGSHRVHVGDKGWCKVQDMRPYTPDNTDSGTATRQLAVGDKVCVKQTATTYATGQRIPDWVKRRADTVVQIDGDRVLLKSIYSWVCKKDIENA